MSQITGHLLMVNTLRHLGVDTIFFLGGGPITEVITESHKLGIKCIDVRDERAAAMMAQAYARVTGKPGVAVSSPAGAVTNMVTGISSALLDCAPVVAIGGSTALGTRELGAFEEIDATSIMKPVTKQAWQIPKTERIPDYVAMAFRHALDGKRGPVFLECPGDVLYGSVNEGEVEIIHESIDMARPAGDLQAVGRAVELLSQAKRPIIISGSGVMWAEAGDDLREFVEVTNIPFYTTPLGRGVIPEDHHLAFLGARSTAWNEADVVLAIGTRANFIVEYFKPPRFNVETKLIVVNIDGKEIGHNRQVEEGIVGDARMVLRQLIEAARERFQGREELPWIDKLKTVDLERRAKLVEPFLNSMQVPIHPMRLCKEVSDFLGRDGILAADGHRTLLFSRQAIPAYHPRKRLDPGPFACMGVAIPFGVGAKAARPEKQVIVLTGELSFGFNPMEIETAVRHNLPLIVVVNNNGGQADPMVVSVLGRDMGHTRYEKLGEAMGGYGERVTEPSQIRPALERASASGLPAVINVITDPVGPAASSAFEAGIGMPRRRLNEV